MRPSVVRSVRKAGGARGHGMESPSVSRGSFRGAGAFASMSRWSAWAMGHTLAFGMALAMVVAWVVLGPVFGFSDTWQLTINTATTVVTFLMVFLIQHTQNHQGEAVQIKLDELIRAVEGAHNMLVDLEDA